MGWAYYEINGKPCGYSVVTTCEEPGCKAKIDRGLGYICGGMPDIEGACGGYFCGEHLLVDLEGDDPQMCRRCSERAGALENGEG